MKVLQNITIGKYIPCDSFIHKLDPRTKIIILFVYMIWVLWIKEISNYIIPAIFITLILLISQIPAKIILINIYNLKYLFLITLILHIFFSEGKTLLWSFGFINISKEGIIQGILITLRLIFLIMGTAIFTLTTSPVQITDATENIFSPLKIIKFPVHEIAMMLSISFRFIPILSMEVDKIMKSQMCRGVDFEKGNLMERINQLIPIFIPLLMNSFRRAEELAYAMESRCYKGGEGRTHFRELNMIWADYFALSLFVLILIVYYKFH